MKKRGINIKLNFTNRWLYSLIAIGILAAIGIGVYAATYSLSGAGHPYTEISTCPNAGQILKMNGGNWVCSADVDTDTKCNASGACSQVCIGSDCKTTWPGGANLPSCTTGQILKWSGSAWICTNFPTCVPSTTDCVDVSTVTAGTAYKTFTCPTNYLMIGIEGYCAAGATCAVSKLKCCRLSCS